MNLKFVFLSLFLFVTLAISAQSDKQFWVEVIDYSNSYDYETHYYIDDYEMKVYTVDKTNPDVIDDLLIHRELLGKERNKIGLYLSLLTMLSFKPEYSDTSNSYTGQRNQKRFSFAYGDKEVSSLVSNTYQQDLANLVIFINRYIRTPELRMLEFKKSY